MPETPTLIVSLPDAETQTFELKGDRIGLGREVDNQVQIDVGAVSSCHCEFRKEGDGYVITDIGSTNGTRVNGKKIESHTLVDGDRLLLGETIAVHYLLLADGEKAKEVATAGSAAQNAAAANYTQLDEKLQSIEADIAAKETEHEELVASLEAKTKEHEQLLGSMKELEEKIAATKASAGDRDGAEVEKEVAQLEKELMLQTRKVQLLATDIDGQQKQMQQMVPGGPAPVLPGAPPAAAPPAAAPPAAAAAPPVAAPPAAAPPVAASPAAAPPAAAAPATAPPVAAPPLAAPPVAAPPASPPPAAAPAKSPIKVAAMAPPTSDAPPAAIPEPVPAAPPAAAPAPVAAVPPAPIPATPLPATPVAPGSPATAKPEPGAKTVVITPPGDKPAGSKSVLLTGADPDAPTKKLLVDAPEKPRPKFNLG